MAADSLNHHELAQNLMRRLEAGLPAAALNALRRSEALARQSDTALYLVGGAVRDLILGRDGYDLDLAVEGDIEGLARELAKATDGRVVVHDRFGTATVKGHGFHIDLARTRRETYPHPGSLPVVEPATLAEDLARRDFTINAIALRLSPEPAELADPYRGVDDVRSSLVRALHERSFQDDATRMLRAVRYASRLGFKIARQTESLIKRDLGYVKNVSGPRLRRELALLFVEPSAVDGVLMAQRLGVLEAIHPTLGVSEAVTGRWREVLRQAQDERDVAGGKRADKQAQENQGGPTRKDHVPLDELGFCVLAAPRDEGTAASVAKWLHLAGRFEKAMHDLVRLRAVSPKLAGASPSQALDVLDGGAPSAVQALGVIEGGEIATACEAYLRTWRFVKAALDGDALVAMGMVPGPLLGETLRRLRVERLEGRISTREQEIVVARRAMEGAEGSGNR